MPRMNILKPDEQRQFDAPPVFNAAQRKRFFDFPQAVIGQAQSLRSDTNVLFFLITYGYFKATKRFLLPQDYHDKDLEYVARRIDLPSHTLSAEDYSNRTRYNHQKLILDFCGFQPFDLIGKQKLLPEIRSMVLSHRKPKSIFWSCINILVKNKIQVPGYFRISELIIQAFQYRKEELSALAGSTLTPEIKVMLDGFFDQVGNASSAKDRYKLTLLKKLSQSSKPAKVQERVFDLLLLQDLYNQLQPILDVLDLDHEAMRYYAGSVIKSQIFQIERRADKDRYIYLIAFIAHQYYCLHDNLIDVFLSTVKRFQNSAKREYKEICFAKRQDHAQSMSKLLDFMDKRAFQVLENIENTLCNGENADSRIQTIETLLADNKADFVSARLEHSLLQGELDTNASQNQYYEILESRSLRLQKRLSGILKTVSFKAENNAAPLMEAILYFRNKEGIIGKTAPSAFLSSNEKAAVFAHDGTFRISLYKVFLFLHVAAAIKSGTLNLEHSYKYQSLDKYMISKNRWLKDKNVIMERAGLEDFSNPVHLLHTLDDALYQQYLEINHSLKTGHNLFLKTKTSKAYHIVTPKQEETESDPLRGFLPEHNFVPLTQVLATVNDHCDFLQEFEHWQNRYTKSAVSTKALFAGVMGLGCSIGTRKMARISSDITENALQHAVTWYFSLDNIQAANDRIVKFMDQMELPNIYRNSTELLHTASDGQKFEVRSESLNANYSFKYFGKGQGVSAYTFIDERNLLWHSLVFSASERESAYVVDGLMHNDVIKSDIHSTDTHGYSEAIFATTHILGFSYAPRIKNVQKQNLYIFKSRRLEDKKDWIIAPNKYVNEDVIIQNWDDILRFIATIKLKETNASDIFRRLNSYSKQNVLYQALKAFGQIIKSIFILRYLDDVGLRQDIEKQLNKIELANRMTRAIAVGNPREYIHAEKEEQETAETCNRLIKNAIICWNYLYLTHKLQTIADPNMTQALRRAIKTHSPMSWAHINLLGEYDFSDEKLKDTFGIKHPKLAV